MSVKPANSLWEGRIWAFVNIWGSTRVKFAPVLKRYNIYSQIFYQRAFIFSQWWQWIIGVSWLIIICLHTTNIIDWKILLFFQLHLSNSVIKKTYLYVEKYWGAGTCLSLHPPCYTYAVNIILFWVMTPCILVEWWQCFIWCKQMMEAAESPKNSVYLQQTARLYISEDGNVFYLKKK